MNKNRFKEYFLQSLTGFGSLALAIMFYFFILNIGKIFGEAARVVDILMPVVYGFVIAFILGPMCDLIEGHLEQWIPPMKNEGLRINIITGISVGLSVIAALILLGVILVLVLPQLFTSIMSIVNSVPVISAKATAWVRKLLQNNPELQTQVLNTYTNIGDMFMNWVQNTFLPRFQQFLNSLSSGLVDFIVVIKNLLIGIIVSFYVLTNRKLYLGQTKKVIYAVLPTKPANYLVFLLRDVRDIFSGFLVGKIVDSLIIGLICFVVMNILKLPYAILISTIVGVTNVIPYFGPFIGAIPSAILILTVSPLQALYFLIFVLILQQVDGNIIGPRILGDTTGLASFWVLISILLFGGLFGIIGMIIGVPVFAVLYDLATKGIGKLAEYRGLSKASADYRELDHVDPENGRMIMKTESRTQTRKDRLLLQKLQKRLRREK
ncbi:MAG: AI-2E family transporter [Lachnospiraceae bacterium]|nr:AI-2E family transporter [Lachnospiraceae bacterium]